MAFSIKLTQEEGPDDLEALFEFADVSKDGEVDKQEAFDAIDALELSGGLTEEEAWAAREEVA